MSNLKRSIDHLRTAQADGISESRSLMVPHPFALLEGKVFASCVRVRLYERLRFLPNPCAKYLRRKIR